MSLNKQLFKYLEANAAKFKTKIAFLDVSMNVSWSEVFLLVLNLTDKLEQEFPFKDKSDQNNGIVIKGDGTVSHILMIFALVLSNRTYIPYNRTLDRSPNNPFRDFPIVTILQNEIWYLDTKWEINHIKEKKPFENHILDAKEVVSAFYYTSGTTGTPKAIANSNSNIFRGALYVIEALDLKNEDKIAGTLLLDFDYGVNQIFCSLVLGATYISCPFSSSTTNWLKMIENNEATVVPAMPFLIESYFPKKSLQPVHSVRLCTSSGAPFTREHAACVEALFPNAEIVPMYGLSEGFRATIMPPGEYKARPDSVGKPIGDTEIRIVNENLEKCSALEIGEILQGSGCISWGYYRDQLATDHKFIRDRDFPNRLWVRSGDLGYLDEDGFLYIKGRVEFQIKLYGIRISIDEIESAYKMVPGIINAVVIPMSVNETESDFAVGIVIGLPLEEIHNNLRMVPKEYRTKELKVIPEVIGNYNGGKPDRNANRSAYFND